MISNIQDVSALHLTVSAIEIICHLGGITQQTYFKNFSVREIESPTTSQ
jgi:hypothetical protein